MTETSRGPLIVVEGIDGSGKSTVVAAIATHLSSLGMQVVQSREPTTGPWGQKVRASFATERLPVDVEVEYLLRDRQQHVRDIVDPALERGDAVVLDRYYPSMVAYQGAAGMSIDELLELNAFAPRPTVLLILDLPAETALDRVRSRGVPNSFEQLETLKACREIFLGFAARGAIVIDAAQAPADVCRAALDAVSAAVPNGRG